MKNKTGIVTGANRGIGYQTVKMLAKKGVTVILTARDKEKGITAVEKLKSDGLDVYFHLLDVSNVNTLEQLYTFIDSQFGKLDILINNAGIIGSTRGFDTTSIEESEKVLNTNFLAPVKVSKILLPLLKKSDDARIINVSSGMGASDSLVGNYSAYRLSKSSLNNFTQILANELSNSKIKVNAVCPGWVKSDMGGTNAPRSLEQGADTIIWLATENLKYTGKFFRDRKVIDW